MSKLVEIDFCDECPHFEDEFRQYEAYCKETNKKLCRDGSGDYEIPDSCSLENI
jgi:hypothetical protein